MKRLIYWGSIAAGLTAAYLMYRRGESLGTIAKKAVSDPVGAFVGEVKQAI